MIICKQCSAEVIYVDAQENTITIRASEDQHITFHVESELFNTIMKQGLTSKAECSILADVQTREETIDCAIPTLQQLSNCQGFNPDMLHHPLFKDVLLRNLTVVECLNILFEQLQRKSES